MIKMNIDGYVRISKRTAYAIFQMNIPNKCLCVTTDDLRPGEPWYPEYWLTSWDPVIGSDQSFYNQLRTIEYYAATKKPFRYWVKYPECYKNKGGK